MLRLYHRLTTLAVKHASRGGLHPDGAGLYLQVAPGGSKSWVLRYRAHGRRRYFGLGGYPRVSLAEARERASAAHALLRSGRDPIQIRHGERTAARLVAARAMSFSMAAARYVESHPTGWSDHSTRKWTSLLANYINPVIGALPVGDVDTGLVLKIVEPIWAAKAVTANRVRACIEEVLDWATARELRVGENPARWKGHIETLLPPVGRVARVKHFAAMAYADVPGFISALRRQNGQAARALELLVLTVTRSNEMLGASWDEIDLIDNVWVIPGSRMKMGKEHRIPLSDAAVSLLGALPGPHVGLVFPGRTPTKPMHHGRLREIDLRGATVHGFRSSFRDWAAECGHYPSEVIEPCLAHAVGSVTERSYLRSDLLDRRRRLMNDWSTFCSGSTREHSELIELKRA